MYRITVLHDGFRPVTRSGVELKVDQVARLDFVLEVGAVSDKVEVTANAPLLDSETSSLGAVVDQSKIVSLPLNGRMTLRLVQLTPGILAPPGSNGQFGDISVGTFDDINFSINGGRAQSNTVVLDGVRPPPAFSTCSLPSPRSMPLRNSKSKATGRLPSTADSGAASSTSPPAAAPTNCMAVFSSSCATACSIPTNFSTNAPAATFRPSA